MTPRAPVLRSEKPRLIKERGECSLQDFRPGTNQPDEAGSQGLPGAQVTAHLVALLYLLEMRLPGPVGWVSSLPTGCPSRTTSAL